MQTEAAMLGRRALLRLSAGWATVGVCLPASLHAEGWAQEFRLAGTPLTLTQPAISWVTLAEVRSVRAANGLEKPQFPSKLKALSGKRRTIRGFMVPLDGGNVQRHFLLCPSRTDCRDDPLKVVYVRLKTKADFNMTEIEVCGTFNVGVNPDTGMYYRLVDAEISPGKQRFG